MRELETHQKLEEKNKIELSVKKKQEIEHVLEGTISPKDGHFIWEINEKTREVKKAEYEKQPAVFAMLKALKPIKKLITKKNCVYIPALNATNAKKKYLKDSNQASYYVKEAPMSLDEMDDAIVNAIVKKRLKQTGYSY